MTTIESLFAWLLDGAPGAKTAVEVADRLGNELLRAGVPLERLGVLVTTLHPDVMGRSFVWQVGKPTRISELSYASIHSPTFAASPIQICARTNREFRWRTGEPDGGYGIIKDLVAIGCVDYVCFPMLFTSGEVHVVSVASKVGFTDEHLGDVRHVMRPLALVAEIYAMRRNATNILSTYVGTSSGERVMAGQIRKGDVETIRAAIWFSDMRGFTELSSRNTPAQMIAILNDVFECQVPAIEKYGGEVLKFIGDGLLAIFPITDAAPAAERCAAALDAAAETFAALVALNSRSGRETCRIGLALHLGDVAYGNIGGAHRLDFTAIGPAVNLAARLEAVASKLGRQMVVSSDFASVAKRTFENLGSFELKGISGAQPVFG